MKVGIRLGREWPIKREESNKIKRDLSDMGMSEQAVTVTVRLSDLHHAGKRDTCHRKGGWYGISRSVDDMEFPGRNSKCIFQGLIKINMEFLGMIERSCF